MREPIFHRRRFLRDAASVAGSLALPARAAAPNNLRNGETLPDPDFSRLREVEPYLVGVRPHRKTGVRLELESAPREGAGGKKHIIHNYGHGGGGITLSWGCASVVVDLVEKLTPVVEQLKLTPSVAVLGTGVIGLTTATELRRKWPTLPITVYARDLNVRNTVSFIAGGQFEPSGIFKAHEGDAAREQLFSYLRKSRDRIVDIQKSGQRHLFGVAERKDYTLDHENKAFDVFTPPDVIPPHRKGRLPFGKLNAPGREYNTWLMNPTILLPKLASDLALAAVSFRERMFATLADVLTVEETIIINCTGFGAKALFGDEDVVAQRGHLVVLKKTHDKQFYFFSGGCSNFVISYVFCRQDDVVIGGSVQSDNDSTTVTPEDDAVFQRLLSNARGLFSGKPGSCKW